MWKFKSCPKCGGDIWFDRDQYGSYMECLQCGSLLEIELINKEEKVASKKQLVSSASGR